jgi:hypothetical protein
LRGARWIPGRVGHGASPISQDSISEGIAYAAEHPDGIAPERFVHYVFDSTSSIFGRYELREFGDSLGMLDWWQGTRADLRMTDRTRNWCQNWIPNHDLKMDPGVAIEDERLTFATTRVIGRWFDRFGGILSSVNPRLIFNFDETMLAAYLSRSQVIVALDERVCRKKHKKPHHFTLGAVFDPLGHGPPPLIVIPTFSGAEWLFMGQDAFVRESRSWWCTGPIFAAFAEHFCGWLTGYRARIGVARVPKQF